MKTCNVHGYCFHRVQEGSLINCNYEGYCDYQAPRDSRFANASNIPMLVCTCGMTGSKCPIHQPNG